MFRLFILTGIYLSLLACASTAPTTPVVPVAQEMPVEHVEAPEKPLPQDSVYPLLLAEFALRRRAYDVALENYMEQAHLLVDPGVRSHATHLAQFMQREDEALEAAQLWIQVEPDNIEVSNTLATLLSRAGRPLEALPYLATVGRGGGEPQYPILLNGFRKLSPAQQSELVEGINELSAEFPTDSQLLITRSLLYEELDQHDLALKTVRAVFENEPYLNQAVLLEAKLLLDRGDKKPFGRLRATLEKTPEDKRLRLQYARMLTRSDLEAARAQFEILSSQSPRDGDLLFSLALINRETGDLLTAKAYLRQMLELEQRVDEGHYYLGRIAEDEEDYKEAIAQYMKVEDGGDFFNANNRIGNILIDAGQIAQLLAYFEQLRDKNPAMREQLYAMEVDLLTKGEQLNDGMAVLSRALQEFPESTALLYTRSMMWEQQDDLHLMESDLRTILAQEPDNATALNALGYSLANRTERYDEAHELIARALALQPNEPAILDSMGWVLYRQGSYEEALEYLSRAYIKYPDPEVAAHLGEVLWVTGKTEAAIDVWRGALLKDPQHKILVATLKRLGVAGLGVTN
jgi:tetratricopeptide (TPR) repeat protein